MGMFSNLVEELHKAELNPDDTVALLMSVMKEMGTGVPSKGLGESWHGRLLIEPGLMGKIIHLCGEDGGMPFGVRGAPVRRAAINLLCRLTMWKPNVPSIVSNDHVMDIFTACIHLNSNVPGAFVNLSQTDENCERLYENPGLVAALCKECRTGRVEEAVQNCGSTLMNLAVVAKLAVPMVRDWDVMDSLLSVCQRLPTTAPAVHSVLKAFFNMSMKLPNLDYMCNHKYMVPTLCKHIGHEESRKVLSRICHVEPIPKAFPSRNLLYFSSRPFRHQLLILRSLIVHSPTDVLALRNEGNCALDFARDERLMEIIPLLTQCTEASQGGASPMEIAKMADTITVKVYNSHTTDRSEKKIRLSKPLLAEIGLVENNGAGTAVTNIATIGGQFVLWTDTATVLNVTEGTTIDITLGNYYEELMKFVEQKHYSWRLKDAWICLQQTLGHIAYDLNSFEYRKNSTFVPSAIEPPSSCGKHFPKILMAAIKRFNFELWEVSFMYQIAHGLIWKNKESADMFVRSDNFMKALDADLPEGRTGEKLRDPQVARGIAVADQLVIRGSDSSRQRILDMPLGLKLLMYGMQFMCNTETDRSDSAAYRASLTILLLCGLPKSKLMSYLAEVQYVDYMVDAFNHHVFEADTCSLYMLMINWGLEMPLDDAKLVSELQRTREIAAIVLDSTKKREDWADAANSARNLMGKIAYLGLTLAEVPVKMVAECLAVYLGTPKLYHAKKQYKPLQEAVARRIGELETGATELPLSGDDFWRNHHGVKDVAYIKDLEGGGEYSLLKFKILPAIDKYASPQDAAEKEAAAAADSFLKELENEDNAKATEKSKSNAKNKKKKEKAKKKREEEAAAERRKAEEPTPFQKYELELEREREKKKQLALEHEKARLKEDLRAKRDRQRRLKEAAEAAKAAESLEDIDAQIAALGPPPPMGDDVPEGGEKLLSPLDMLGEGAGGAKKTAADSGDAFLLEINELYEILYDTTPPKKSVVALIKELEEFLGVPAQGSVAERMATLRASVGI
ncbi:hypothetical protein TeGR_g4280 [Tetraparma gracilis]|uniref:Uncharacterized protein n=1 Tax=Tetraparma gracilis TaxID=2962635 RepID=A0ABQ6N9A2_9STRA|nr:hypothetical protein TeGR_g4280 [Tetraparma gracilis]